MRRSAGFEDSTILPDMRVLQTHKPRVAVIASFAATTRTPLQTMTRSQSIKDAFDFNTCPLVLSTTIGLNLFVLTFKTDVSLCWLRKPHAWSTKTHLTMCKFSSFHVSPHRLHFRFDIEIRLPNALLRDASTFSRGPYFSEIVFLHCPIRECPCG